MNKMSENKNCCLNENLSDSPNSPSASTAELPGRESSSGEKNRVLGGTLYLVATPIGNLSDITFRAAKVLEGCNFIAAEDTRVTAKLLQYLGFSKPMIPYHEHNKRTVGEQIAARLAVGESCALVTDAGTPGISDPGSDIAALCISREIPVTSVPGSCAAINALILSGFDTRRFCFEGFLPERKKDISNRLEELKNDRRSIIFYSSPHDLRRVLDTLYSFLGDRSAAVCREMTKLNEEIIRKPISELIELYSTKEPRGEYVIIVKGFSGTESAFWTDMTPARHVAFYESGGMSRMDAIKAAASDRGVPKNTVYKALIDDGKG